jgi:ACS family glucarate transporter-like MFS transporter
MNPASRIRIRWRIFGFLFGFGFLAYLQQKSITVAAAPMMPDLGFTQLQIGWLEQGFTIGYAVFQIPVGIFAERWGARGALVLMGLVAATAMIATPLAPSLFTGTALFAGLVSLQVLLGVSQAATFPVSAGVFQQWFPPHRWASVIGLQTMGLQLGAAVTPPLIASLMHFFGWRSALFWTTLPALVFVVWWGWYGRGSPSEHPAVTPQELAEIGDHGTCKKSYSITAHQVLHLLGDRNVLLLTLSYLTMNYVFYLISNWAFLYLIQERHFSVLESGWLAAIPPLGAAFGAGVGGVLTGIACRRLGSVKGFRRVPLLALPAAGVLLLLIVVAANAYLAVAGLALCFGLIELTEGAFWGAAMTVGRSDTMVVTSIMNTGGTMGGIIGIPIVAYLSGHGHWHATFLIGSALALISTSAWFVIDLRTASANPTDPRAASPASAPVIAV